MVRDNFGNADKTQIIDVSMHAEEDDCIFNCSAKQSTNVDMSFLKDQVNISDGIKEIVRKRDLTELWPLSSNDSGHHFCTRQQNSTYDANNLTMEEKMGFYCNDSSLKESLTKTLGEPITITIPDVYKTPNYSTSWYKDCKEYVKNTSEISFTSVQQADSAVYTYIVTRMYNGDNYNVCGIKELIVKAQKEEIITTKKIFILRRPNLGRRENIRPKIKGVGNEITEVEIGKNHSLKCEAYVYTSMHVDLYWIRTNKSEIEDPNDILDDCNETISRTCIQRQPGVNNQVELQLINISEDDIKYPYKCKLDSPYGTDIRIFELKLKDKSQDISEKVFTTSLVASITCSVSIVFLIGLCILFRIPLVLFYRNITGVDETIGDGKEYDAYLSFENFSTCESDERHFTFQTLAPILENSFGYKLCIFDRDVVPGGALADDVNSFLEKSRRLIIVLSKDFTSCKAMYELESGLHKAMVERKIKVILIEFALFSEQSFQLESLQLLKMKNRVKWKGDKSRPLNSQFWKTIQYLMPAKPIRPSSSFAVLRKMQTDDHGKT
ncbi:interleukin-18 receptor 1 [Dendropsophus ebraccatus]|uniref:interleukin-18 receptor 1 n=1 Tax=Dendropsophus ebraccatus TaxID=150705 RepID=UPI00383221BE